MIERSGKPFSRLNMCEPPVDQARQPAKVLVEPGSYRPLPIFWALWNCGAVFDGPTWLLEAELRLRDWSKAPDTGYPAEIHAFRVDMGGTARTVIAYWLPSRVSEQLYENGKGATDLLLGGVSVTEPAVLVDPLLASVTAVHVKKAGKISVVGSVPVLDYPVFVISPAGNLDLRPVTN